jgi:hypothetical protein
MAIDRGTQRKGDPTRKPQKYQNSYAYKHNKNSKLTRKIAATPIHGVCQRCTDIIEWRKKYRKYKPLTVPKKCVKCAQKTVHEAYHVICNACSSDHQVCAKCQDPLARSGEALLGSVSPLVSEEDHQRIDHMRERERRTYLRHLEEGKIPHHGATVTHFGKNELEKGFQELLFEESDFSDDTYSEDEYLNESDIDAHDSLLESDATEIKSLSIHGS